MDKPNDKQAEKRRIQKSLIEVALAAVLAISIYNLVKFTTVWQEKKVAINTVTNIAETQGLTDVSVNLRSTRWYYSKWYEVDITCSNWGDQTPQEMLSVYRKMEAELSNARLKIWESGISLSSIYSENDRYEMYTSPKSRAVYKNRHKIYDESSETVSVSSKDSTGHDRQDAIEIAMKGVRDHAGEDARISRTSVTNDDTTWRIEGSVYYNKSGVMVSEEFVISVRFTSRDNGHIQWSNYSTK